MRSFLRLEINFRSITFYLSSLAAYSLQQMGLLNATDMIGGYGAWKAAGLPIDLDSRQEESRSLVSLAGSVAKLDPENSV
jgi:3-mercaptopyruvate sulfurtransferase SseA